MTPTEGWTLGRYRLVEKLGQGGMGIVWKALDTQLEREVAIKLLPATTRDDASMRQRLLREARSAAAIQHPNICNVFEVGEAEGHDFIAMELVEGQTLEARLACGRMEIDEVIRIATEIAEALEFAHAKNIIHRDLKPSNLMLSSQGHVKILDFGLAKKVTTGVAEGSMADTVSRITGAHTVVGTVGYMSPEQLRGQEADRRSDLFTFGIVLYEMAAGKHPFPGSTVFVVVGAILNQEPEALSQVRRDAPAGLNELLKRLLAKEPAERYEHAGEVRAALDQVRRGAAPPVAAKAGPSIAVLPFRDMSPEQDQAYFCEGLAEELIHGLMRVDGLRVAARTSAFRYGSADHDIRQIGKDLRVSTVLEGSVRKAGDRLRITAQLSGVDDGYQLWSDRYDRRLDDVFEIQDGISRAIVEVLESELLPESDEPLVPRPTTITRAYEYNLRGRYLANKRNEAALRKALELFDLAVREDPGYAAAHAGLADAYALLGIYGAMPPAEAMPRARAAADKALSLDPEHAAALVSLGCVKAVHDWDWAEAERSFRRAIELEPQYPAAHHWFATNALLPRARFDEARSELEIALELDPLSAVIATSHGFVSFLQRDYDDAVGRYRQVLELDPDFAMAHYFLGQALERLDAHEEALAALERARAATGGSPETVAALAHAAAAAGDPDRARGLIAELERLACERHVSPTLIGQARLGLGEHDTALDWLERGAEERSAETIWLAVRPVFDPLRDDPRFRSLLDRIGLDSSDS